VRRGTAVTPAALAASARRGRGLVASTLRSVRRVRSASRLSARATTPFTAATVSCRARACRAAVVASRRTLRQARRHRQQSHAKAATCTPSLMAARDSDCCEGSSAMHLCCALRSLRPRARRARVCTLSHRLIRGRRRLRDLYWVPAGPDDQRHGSESVRRVRGRLRRLRRRHLHHL
jgi:hypothetical protein